MEIKLIHNLTKKFKLRKDIGREHFEGNIFDIMEAFLQTVKENIDIDTENSHRDEDLLSKIRMNIVREFLEDSGIQIDSNLSSFSNTKTYDTFLFWKETMDINENVNYKYFKESLILLKNDIT